MTGGRKTSPYGTLTTGLGVSINRPTSINRQL